MFWLVYVILYSNDHSRYLIKIKTNKLFSMCTSMEIWSMQSAVHFWDFKVEAFLCCNRNSQNIYSKRKDCFSFFILLILKGLPSLDLAFSTKTRSWVFQVHIQICPHFHSNHSPYYFKYYSTQFLTPLRRKIACSYLFIILLVSISL